MAVMNVAIRSNNSGDVLSYRASSDAFILRSSGAYQSLLMVEYASRYYQTYIPIKLDAKPSFIGNNNTGSTNSNNYINWENRECKYYINNALWSTQVFQSANVTCLWNPTHKILLIPSYLSGAGNGAPSFNTNSGTLNSCSYPVVPMVSGAIDWDTIKFYTNPVYAFEMDSSTTGGVTGADWNDDSTDDISLVSETDLNVNSLSSTKFVTTYMLSVGQMNDLGDKLWGILSALGNSVLKPQDFIISCCMIPYTTTGVTKLIKAGWILLDGAEGTVIDKQYVRLSCGTLSLPEKWGSAIDYQTQLSIVLPFIGERALSAQEFIGGQIKVEYTIDLISGACVAAISSTRGDLDSVLYQFTGNCAAQIPITSQDFSRLLGGIGLTAQSGSGSMNGASTANITSKTGERTKQTDTDTRTESSQSSRNSGVNSNLNFSAFAPQCNKTGDLSRTIGFMTIRKPYLIIRRPIQSLPEKFKSFKGYVSNITAVLSTLSGYTEVGFCNLSVPSATDTELMEIRALLSSGVLI